MSPDRKLSSPDKLRRRNINAFLEKSGYRNIPLEENGESRAEYVRGSTYPRFHLKVAFSPEGHLANLDLHTDHSNHRSRVNTDSEEGIRDETRRLINQLEYSQFVGTDELRKELIGLQLFRLANKKKEGRKSKGRKKYKVPRGAKSNRSVKRIKKLIQDKPSKSKPYLAPDEYE